MAIPPANAPCKDCEDRHLGCHSMCNKYILFDTERKQILLEERKRTLFNSIIKQYQIDKYTKAKKRKRGR